MLNLKNLTYYCNSLKSEREQLLQTPGLDSDDYLVSRKRANGKTSIFIRKKNPKDISLKKDTYVNKELLPEARIIARVMLAKKQLADIDMKIKVLDNLIRLLHRPSSADSYLQCHPWLQELLPQALSNGEKLLTWKNEPYERNMKYSENIICPTVVPNLFTRSKSEAAIISRFEHFGIPYHYDEIRYFNGTPLAIDFVCINVSTGKQWYWDHRGMLDDKSYIEKTLYCEGVLLNAGIISGINLIVTAETSAHPLDMQEVDEMIHYYLL
ncbi:MAG: hypothetical protein MJ086_06820 [Lachnospiraceae bacterium]|nr:hypothetical protein [Lachnospiraceae bacterium]